MSNQKLESLIWLYGESEFEPGSDFFVLKDKIANFNKFDESKYLTGIPQEMEEHGLCKTMIVRNEIINIKHILTEVFVRRSISLEGGILKKFDISLVEYIEYITNRLRRIHKFSRQYRAPIDEIVKSDRKSFFPTLWLYNGLKNVIVLDFDGVCTANNFRELYELCIARCEVVICSANPTVTDGWFEKRGMSLPAKIYACKGKTAKFKKLLEIQKKYDNCFYIDNEAEYLAPAWCIGMKTFIWKNNKIKHFSMHTK